ncbi:Putative ribonuclease H protein At1g65750 [Linum grandiflorum]
MTPMSVSLGLDSMVWGLELSGKFTIRSAYLLLTDLQEETSDPQWKGVWNWQGTNKIHHFLWLASHNRLLTNEECGRRHLTNQVLCSFCSIHTESCIHILRDCHFARQVWRKIMPQIITGEELIKDWRSWLDTHIRHREDSHSLTFGVGIWLMWRDRNKHLFEQDTETYVEVAHWCDYWVALITSSWKTGQLGREVLNTTRQTQLIGWRLSDEGCFTLRTDGSLRSPTKLAGAGGVIRTWEVNLSHIYREANNATDYLANFGHSFTYGLHIFDSPDRDLSHWLHYNFIGVSLPRIVRIYNNN